MTKLRETMLAMAAMAAWRQCPPWWRPLRGQGAESRTRS